MFLKADYPIYDWEVTTSSFGDETASARFRSNVNIRGPRNWLVGCKMWNGQVTNRVQRCRALNDLVFSLGSGLDPRADQRLVPGSLYGS